MAGKPDVPKADQVILERIRDRRDFAVDYWSDQRDRAADEVLFCDKDHQWPEAERVKRVAASRPCITVDHTNAFIDQIVNDERQNRPAVNVSPVHDGADVDTAEVIQGYFRHVEMSSNASYAYDRASEHQKRGGFGFIRIGTKYVKEDSFDQDITIESIPNAFAWYLDPMSMEPDGSDAEWAVGQVEMTREEFEDAYPNASLPGSGGIRSIVEGIKGWFGKDNKTVIVAEYYELKRDDITIVALPGGKTIDKSKLTEAQLAEFGQLPERKTTNTTCKWYKTNGFEILDRRDFPGKKIPIIPVYGKELIAADGKRDYSGLVRPMKDVAYMINVTKSNIMEAMSLAPKSPWIIPKGAIIEGDRSWDTSNIVNHAKLTYNAWDSEGRQLPSPQRITAEVAIQAMTMTLQGWENDLKAVTGLYDPSRGQAESNQSGVAIARLQRQGQTGNFHFTDNFNRSLCQVWRVVLGMMPEVLDTERLLRIIGVDGQEHQVRVNTAEPVDGIKPGVKAIFDLTAAEGFDIHISAGPSYATKRQENVAVLMDLVGKIPALGEMGADLLIRQIDFPEAKEFADRVTPPQFKTDQGGQPPIPAEFQQKMQSYEQMVDQLTKALGDAHNKLDNKTLELQSRERIANLEQQTELIKTAALLDARAAEALLGHEMARIEHVSSMMPPAPGSPQHMEQQQAQMPSQDQTPAAEAGEQPMQPEPAAQPPADEAGPGVIT